MSRSQLTVDAKASQIAAAGGHVDTGPLLKVAEKAATAVRRAAASQGDQVVVKVSARTNGVRVSVSGPRARRYKQMVDRAIEEQTPQAAHVIKASILRELGS